VKSKEIVEVLRNRETRSEVNRKDEDDGEENEKENCFALTFHTAPLSCGFQNLQGLDRNIPL